MIPPKFIIEKSDYVSSGGLRSVAYQKVANLLLRGGKVIVASDTCYSLTAIADDPSLFDFYKKSLNRRDFPISVVFANVLHAQKFAQFDLQVASFIEQFTPGPITIVCKVKDTLKKQAYSKNVLHALDETIGIRIPDSVVERELAAIAEYPITTVAIRDDQGNVVQDFEQAVQIVSKGMNIVNETNWCAIRTNHDFVDTQSTVIKLVKGDGTFDIIRDGAVTLEALNNAAQIIPNWYYRVKK